MSLTIFSVGFLWNKTLICAFLLLTVALIKFLFFPRKKDVFWYLLGFILGPLFEVFVIWQGAWEYTKADLFSIPLWLPFLWGLAAIAGRELAESLN